MKTSRSAYFKAVLSSAFLVIGSYAYPAAASFPPVPSVAESVQPPAGPSIDPNISTTGTIVVDTGSIYDHTFQDLIIHLPLGARIHKVVVEVRHLKPRKGGGNKQGPWAKVKVGQDFKWAKFENQSVVTTPTNVEVKATISNHSDLYKRYVRMTVYWNLPR